MKRKVLKQLICVLGMVFMTFPAWSAVPSNLLPEDGNLQQTRVSADFDSGMILAKGGKSDSGGGSRGGNDSGGQGGNTDSGGQGGNEDKGQGGTDNGGQGGNEDKGQGGTDNGGQGGNEDKGQGGTDNGGPNGPGDGTCDGEPDQIRERKQLEDPLQVRTRQQSWIRSRATEQTRTQNFDNDGDSDPAAQ